APVQVGFRRLEITSEPGGPRRQDQPRNIARPDEPVDAKTLLGILQPVVLDSDAGHLQLMGSIEAKPRANPSENQQAHKKAWQPEGTMHCGAKEMSHGYASWNGSGQAQETADGTHENCIEIR